ncbi:thiamine phosphate synthase [Pontibacter locisalis]|uniref:Thiamine phosphate synthase n=1 Tax=Pontibacter locisalis TaxID=1719035 RepID=A0ABW5INW4_9BACT
MKLIVISSPAPITREPLRINELFEAGLEYFHVRKPDYPKEQLRQLLQQIHPEHYSKIALHQHHELSGEFGINRLHFTEQSRSITPAAELLKLKSEGYYLSTSVHSTEALQQLPPCFAYTFFGPVFNSISKPGYATSVLAGFCLTAAEKAVPVIALGGIDAEKIAQLVQMNFDGAAILGSIWKQPEQAVNNFTRIKEKCQTLAHTY